MTSTERLAELADGANPRMVLRLRSGFVVMADNQWLRGYCLLLAYPVTEHLTDLGTDERAQFLYDMSLVGEAVMSVTECKRMNYAMYGNVDPFLHAHVWPRYEWEVPEYAMVPPLAYPQEIREHEDTVWDPKLHTILQDQIRRMLLHIMEQRGQIPHVH